MIRVVVVRRQYAQEVGDHPENRQKILGVIDSAPGIHKSALCRELGLAWGTTTHHLDVLLALGLIRSSRIGTRVHYASRGTIQEQLIQQAMMMPHSKDIMDLFASRKVLGPTQICNELGLSRKVVRTHLSALLEDGLLDWDRQFHPRFWLRHEARQ